MSDTNMTTPPTPPAMEKEEKEGNFFSENKKLIVAGLIIVLMLIFIFRNLHDVAFSLVFFTVQMPMVVVILSFFAMGAITVWVYSYFGKKEIKRKLKAAEKRLKQLGEKLP